MNQLDQMRNFIDRRIKTLNTEEIDAIGNLDFETASSKSAIQSELYNIKAELNRLSWLDMESKLPISVETFINPILDK